MIKPVKMTQKATQNRDASYDYIRIRYEDKIVHTVNEMLAVFSCSLKSENAKYRTGS